MSSATPIAGTPSTDSASFAALVREADVAAWKREWPLAERLWGALHERFPESARVTLGLAEALLQQTRHDAAERLLVTALLAFPEDRAISEALARVAVGRTDWQDAERRWSSITGRFPESAAAWHGLAFARLKSNDLAGAEAAATEGVERFPAHVGLLSVHATLASQTHDWPEAERRWEKLRATAPQHPSAWLLKAKALRAQQRPDEAAALLTEAVELFPANRDLAGLLADLALALGNWSKASTILNRLCAVTPDDRGLQVYAFEIALRAAGSADAQEAARALEPPAIPPGNEARDLMRQFAAFGDDREFAAVQRHFGAEPIELLRWAEIPTARLAEALAADLAGIGDPDNTTMSLSGDYKVLDRRYAFKMSTWIKEKQADPEKFFADQCRRLQFLTREFLDDLREGEKIFVYKSSNSDPLAHVERLHAAMRRHGTAPLLYVRVSDAEHRHGSVEQVKPGLLIGYLDRLFDMQTAPTIDVEGWIKLCRNAIGIVDADAAQAHEHSPRDLFMRFESMGNNCELGLTQRHYGAEPLGWLRWTSTTLVALAEAIETGLTGFGDPKNTEVVTGGDDYLATDPRYDLVIRTFVRGGHIGRDTLLGEQCRRMRLLRERLLRDLASGTKIFVHKTGVPVNLDDVTRLGQAIRRHGPGTLLHVRPPDTDHPSGTLRALAPGLLVGHLDRLVVRGGLWDVAHEDWRELCRRARHMATTPVGGDR